MKTEITSTDTLQKRCRTVKICKKFFYSRIVQIENLNICVSKMEGKVTKKYLMIVDICVNNISLYLYVLYHRIEILIIFLKISYISFKSTEACLEHLSR